MLRIDKEQCTLSKSSGWVQHVALAEATPPKYQRDNRGSSLDLVLEGTTDLLVDAFMTDRLDASCSRPKQKDRQLCAAPCLRLIDEHIAP